MIDENIVNDIEVEKAVIADRENPYASVLPFILNICFPIVNYDGLILQQDEFILYASYATTYNEKEKVVGYAGKSAGVSFRIAKGVSIRTGGMGGTAIRRNVRENFEGDLIITNKRIVFVAPKNGFEFNAKKVTACKLVSRSELFIQCGSKSKNVEVPECLTQYILGSINTVLEATINGTDLCYTNNQYKQRITDETLALCDEVRNYFNSQKPTNRLTLPKTDVQKNKEAAGWLFGLTIIIGSIGLLIDPSVNGKMGFPTLLLMGLMLLPPINDKLNLLLGNRKPLKVIIWLILLMITASLGS